jgi:long-chain acyl-CoA synthetase
MIDSLKDVTRISGVPHHWAHTAPDAPALFEHGKAVSYAALWHLIIRSGFNVYPIEVESVINSFPGVRLSAVVGRETADRNEEVVAFVETLPGIKLDLDALQRYLKDRLSPYKRPSAIIELPAIPATASGKLLKRELKRLAQEAAPVRFTA